MQMFCIFLNRIFLILPYFLNYVLLMLNIILFHRYYHTSDLFIIRAEFIIEYARIKHLLHI